MKQTARERGQALVEFSFVLPVLAVLALGAVNFALALQQAMLVNESATEGALVGSFDTYASTNVSQSQQAASFAGTGAIGLSTVPSYFCTCAPGGSSVSCASSCSGDDPMMYFQVTATSSFSSIFPFSTLPKVFNLKSTVVMPVQ